MPSPTSMALISGASKSGKSIAGGERGDFDATVLAGGSESQASEQGQRPLRIVYFHDNRWTA